MAVVFAEGQLKNGRGQVLHWVSYTPTTPKAILLFQTGLGEHGGRYKAVFGRIAADADVTVFQCDPHGHGLSEPKEEKKRVFFEHFEDLIDDAMLFLDTVVLPNSNGLPVFVGGHSLGGLCAVHTLLRRQNVFAGLIIDAAAIDIEWTPSLRFQAKIGGCLAGCVPYAKLVPAVRPEDMSGDPIRVAAYKEDPLIYQGNLKSRSGNEILKGMKSLKKQYDKITVPIYAAHGTKDKCTSIQAAKKLVDAAKSTNKTWNEVQGGFHEMMLENDGVVDSLVIWLKEQAKGAAATIGAAKAEAPDAGKGEAKAGTATAAPAAAKPEDIKVQA